MRNVLAAVCVLFVVACTDTAPDESDLLGPSETVQTVVPTQTGAETFFGPDRFTRARGAPVTETRTIDPAGYGPPFTLHLVNGEEDGSRRVASASVRLDGEPLFGSRDFDERVEGHTREVTLDGPTTLEVSLAGAPGDFLEIYVEGEPLATRFCPPEAAQGLDAYANLHSAIRATDPGGTIVVCDGVHPVPFASIDRPLTLPAENPLQAAVYTPFATTPIANDGSVSCP